MFAVQFIEVARHKCESSSSLFESRFFRRALASASCSSAEDLRPSVALATSCVDDCASLPGEGCDRRVPRHDLRVYLSARRQFRFRIAIDGRSQ